MRARVVYPDTDYDYGEEDLTIIDETRPDEEELDPEVYLGEI